MKNIPLPTPDHYRRTLIEKIESFVTRLRWKAHFFLSPESTNDKQQQNDALVHGLKSSKAPPQVKELSAFEDDLVKMTENLEFRPVNDAFLNKLSKDADKIRKSPNMPIFADKTRSIYEMNPDQYDKLLTENVTETYKLNDEAAVKRVNKEAKAIATKLHTADKMETIARNEAFISLKDHKENFANNPKCRLINPSKPELGKISKTILDRINNDLRAKTTANQWRNSESVTTWYKAIPDKNRHSFISFDIVDFYPSISESLLNEAIVWARSQTSISDDEIATITAARKSLLFHQNKPWIKRDNDNMFDVTMGSNDGAEVCELIGLYILNKASTEFGADNTGLYRDDGLILVRNSTGRLSERRKKDLLKLLHDMNLKCTATANLKIVNFLGLTLNLNDGSFQPFKKPNDEILYIDSHSNHPPAVIKQLPKSLSQRISKLSSDKNTFESAAPTCNTALHRSNFRTNIQYEPNTNMV